MKVLHVYAGPFPSHQGTQMVIGQMLRAQVDAGFHVALRCWGSGPGTVPAGVDIRRTDRLEGSARTVSGPHWTRLLIGAQMWRDLRHDLSEQWDVVHAHHVEAPVLARLAGATRMVHHFHSPMQEELGRYFRGSEGRSSRVGRWIDGLCCRAGDVTIALSERGARVAAASGARRVMQIPPALPDVSGNGARFATAHGLEGRWAVYTGNLDPYQDPHRIVELASSGDTNILVVTGDPLSRSIVGRLSRHPNVRLIHSVDPQVHFDALVFASLALVPRGQCGGVPVKAFNALALGTPVVGCTGAIESLAGVELCTPSNWVEMVSKLMNSPEKLGRLTVDVARGREAIAAESLAGRYKALYRELDLPC